IVPTVGRWTPLSANSSKASAIKMSLRCRPKLALHQPADRTATLAAPNSHHCPIDQVQRILSSLG
ncbi:MAG TPA: hypothetical protein VE641_01305, partial [Chthoniobacterales bacterium]|nr:hypothetical protein [Chthoniobacterales bacterium]